MRHFSLRILLLLLVLATLSAGLWQTLRDGYYWWAFFAATGIVACVMLIFHRINATNRKLAYFFSALENDDYTIRFIEHEGIRSERMLNTILNRIKEIIQNTRLEIQQKERYYELILNNISSGVIALDGKGFVVQSNRFALKLLGLEVFTHTSQLLKVSTQLHEAFARIRAGENRKVAYTNERGTVQLLLNATHITIRGREITLIVFNDIENEMDENEIDSWIRLIRILSHEIMNSVAPITSLSDTLLRMHEGEGVEATEMKRNTVGGLRVISETGKGLIAFVESYRKFTRIPEPVCEVVNLNEFLHRMVILCSAEPHFNAVTIRTEIRPDELTVTADPNLLGQVVLNLMKNAIQSMQGQANGLLRLAADREGGHVYIRVTDNGPGIPTEIINEIFVPFFTTKAEGSGIGLSIARQIMRAHGGNIKVTSIPAGETTFTLTV